MEVSGIPAFLGGGGPGSSVLGWYALSVISCRLADCRRGLYEENVRKHLGHCLDVAAEEDEARRSRDESAAVVVEFIVGERIHAVGSVLKGRSNNTRRRYWSDGYKC